MILEAIHIGSSRSQVRVGFDLTFDLNIRLDSSFNALTLSIDNKTITSPSVHNQVVQVESRPYVISASVNLQL